VQSTLLRVVLLCMAATLERYRCACKSALFHIYALAEFSFDTFELIVKVSGCRAPIAALHLGSTQI
jgi:hypothetical protein